jgi:hypothetical protein
MKRTISILVIVAMMLASVLAIVPAYAAEPTGEAITNEAEFLAMTADGTYYLANDITLTKNYEADFAGTFDGNGKTVTLVGYVSMFNKLASATISNLNIVADFTADSSKMYGPLAIMANGFFTDIHTDVKMIFPAEGAGNFSNQWGGIIAEFNGAAVLQNSSVSGEIRILSTGGGNDIAFTVGGLVGKAMGGHTFELKNCVNYADVECKTYRTSNGGLVGALQGNGKITFDGCANYGSVTGMTGDHSGTAGFLGAANCNHQASSAVTFLNSRNYGNISDVTNPNGKKKDHAIGGFFGRGYGLAAVTAENCINSGNITSVGGGWSSAGGILAGVMTYNFDWSKNTTATFTLKNCINLGNVSGASYSGGIVGGFLQINSKNAVATFENCANYGEVDHGGILGFTGCGGALGFTMTNCYNGGKVGNGGGFVGSYDAEWDAAAIDKSMIDVRPAVTFTNCVNDAEALTAIVHAASNFDLITITGCATTVADQALAPESEKFAVTETPDDAAAAKTAVLALVPANPADLDALVEANKNNDPADYTEGWDAFAPALEQALIIANKASSKEDIDLATDDLNKAIEGLVVNTELDISELEAALVEAYAISEDEDLYTPITWAVFAATLEKAEAAADAEKQSEINKATAALISAMAALEFKPDFDALDAAMAQYADLVEAEYTTASWKVYAEALAAAQAVRANENATGSQVQKVITDLDAAAAALAKKADTASLQAKVTDVKTKYAKDKYTAKSYEPTTQALRNADDAIESGDVSAKDIADLIAALDAAIAKLEEKADFTELKALVDATAELSEKDYTEESWKEFLDARDDAEDAMKPGSANNITKAKAAELLTALQEAKDALIAWADYAEIDTIIAEVNGLKADDYTAESWKALQDAITAVNALKSDRNATKPQSDEALANLKAAKEALATAAPEATAAPTDEAKPTGDTGNKGGCGGFIATSVAVVAVVSVLGTAVVLKKKED